MKTKHINSPHAHDLSNGYSQAVLVEEPKQTLYISGQIPMAKDGTVSAVFSEQAEQAWANVEAQLKEAGMGLENIVRHTTYLSDRKYRADCSMVRLKVFGDLQPALTVIIAGIFDESWLLEIEAVAVR